MAPFCSEPYSPVLAPMKKEKGEMEGCRSSKRITDEIEGGKHNMIAGSTESVGAQRTPFLEYSKQREKLH